MKAGAIDEKPLPHPRLQRYPTYSYAHFTHWLDFIAYYLCQYAWSLLTLPYSAKIIYNAIYAYQSWHIQSLIQPTSLHFNNKALDCWIAPQLYVYQEIRIYIRQDLVTGSVPYLLAPYSGYLSYQSQCVYLYTIENLTNWQVLFIGKRTSHEMCV